MRIFEWVRGSDDAEFAIFLQCLDKAINQSRVDAGVVATDQEVAAAVAFAFAELKLVVEPGGAKR